MTKDNLPAIDSKTIPFIEEITNTLGINRNVLAPKKEILALWDQIPREIGDIPKQNRSDLIARMTIAISTGLFDSAINYIWNASIIHLREKVINFDLEVVKSLVGKKLDRHGIYEMRDHKLLDLCLNLNLIDKDGHFFLNQNREIRNGYSAAHPADIMINDRETLSFINRCIVYILTDTETPKGIRVNEFTDSLENSIFTEMQIKGWKEKLNNTNELQRSTLINMLYYIYCDSSSSQVKRNNSTKLFIEFSSSLSSDTINTLLESHYKYKTETPNKYTASKIFFTKNDLISLLNNGEKHTIISKVCSQLYDNHMGMNNFYNEPPFAKRLLEITRTSEVPKTVKKTFVNTILICKVGNRFGVSHAAEPYYDSMIQNFKPYEIGIMLNLLKDSKNLVSIQVKDNANCKKNYIEALELIDSESLTPKQKVLYDKILTTLS